MCRLCAESIERAKAMRALRAMTLLLIAGAIGSSVALALAALL
jgi:hypothetical protein